MIHCLICDLEFESYRQSKLCCSLNCEKIRKSLYDTERYAKTHRYSPLNIQVRHRILMEAVRKQLCRIAIKRPFVQVIDNQIDRYCTKRNI